MNTTEKTLFIIKNRHREAMLEREKILQTLRKNNDFCALENSLDVLKWEYAKNVAYEKPVDALQKQIEGVEKEIADFLHNNNVNVNILEENYLCPICKDTGIIDGKLCACAEKERIALELEENRALENIPVNLNDINFSFYKTLDKNYKKYASFIEKFFLFGDKSFLIISGGAGVGKTYLAYTALKQSLLNGSSVKIFDAIKLNREFLNYHCAPFADKQSIWENMTNYDLMLIDNLGAEQLFNNVTLPYLYELLVDRMNKKTIFTTNLDLPNLETKYGQRLFSRFCDVRNSAFLPITAPDFRFMQQ